MGITDMFGPEDRVSVKYSDFYNLVKEAAKAEVMNDFATKVAAKGDMGVIRIFMEMITDIQIVTPKLIMGIPDITPEPDRQQEPKQEPKPKPAPKPAAKQKIELDVGKIKALHDAGWSMQKIADEMNVSMQTIANRLKEAKNE